MSSIPEWEWGLMVGVIASFASASGMILFKSSADREKGLPLWRRWLWCAGFALLLLNSIVLDPVAISLAPVALMSPLSGLGICFSLILARFFLNAELRMRNMTFIGIMVAGIITVSAFGPHPDRVVTLEVIYARGLSVPAAIFLGALLALVISDLSIKSCAALRKFRPPEQSVMWSFLAGLAAVSCSAITSMCLKVVATAVRAYLDADSLEPIFRTMPLVPACAVALVTAAPLLLYLINSSLGAASAAYAIPVYKGLSALSGVLQSAVVWQEFKDEPLTNRVVFAVGMLVVMGSVVALSHAEAAAEAQQQQKDESKSLI